jgi:hypothetical protein
MGFSAILSRQDLAHPLIDPPANEGGGSRRVTSGLISALGKTPGRLVTHLGGTKRRRRFSVTAATPRGMSLRQESRRLNMSMVNTDIGLLKPTRLP